jgi:hypothetical protein
VYVRLKKSKPSQMKSNLAVGIGDISSSGTMIMEEMVHKVGRKWLHRYYRIVSNASGRLADYKFPLQTLMASEQSLEDSGAQAGDSPPH